ncbi:hypothetical protein CWI38_0139p0030 [Hamiltosporidium tvaerminnensis]|uniref:Uncharacterized protein n=1 Tax=Hamiltosporidium tvaerminnensis TaxID=1176355 RepID=A0A4Q9M0B7_9MICR|nr:hypothetical protein CWI38_0139p0030 [Hamiltosporidium tvaerminnensis]
MDSYRNPISIIKVNIKLDKYNRNKNLSVNNRNARITQNTKVSSSNFEKNPNYFLKIKTEEIKKNKRSNEYFFLKIILKSHENLWLPGKKYLADSESEIQN